MALSKETFADGFFADCSLPSAALGKAFAECNRGFAECPKHSAKSPSAVVYTQEQMVLEYSFASRRSFPLPSFDRQLLRLRTVSILGTLGLTGSACHSGSCRHVTLSVE